MALYGNPTAVFQPVLAQALNALGDNRFVGTRILGTYQSPVSEGGYPVFGAEQFDNDQSKKRAPGSAFARNSFDYDEQTFKTTQYGIETKLPDEQRNKATQDGLNDIAATISDMDARNVMVGHEVRVSTLLYGASFNSTAATDAMSSAATAKPIVDIQNAVERLSNKGFMDRIALVIEQSLYNELINTDDMRNITNGAGSYPNGELLRSIVGVDEVIICSANYNTAAKGKSASRSKIWPTDKYFVGQVAGGNFSAGGVGRTIAYNPNGGLMSVESYRDEKVKSDILRTYNEVDEVIINTNAGELITGA